MEGRNARVGTDGTRRIDSARDRGGKRKARPERIRFTFFDDATLGAPLPLPNQRNWIAGIIFAIVFAIFTSIAAAMIGGMSRQSVRDVFDLMFFLFQLFWVIGWSVGVLVLGLLALLFFFHRESARIERGRLLVVPRLGPLKAVCEYDLAKMSNLRMEPVNDGSAVRIRFDYANGHARIGDKMPRDTAEAMMEQLRRAAPTPAPLAPVEDQSRAAAAPEGAVRARGVLPAPPPSLTAPSTLALIAANLVPLLGVLVFGWDLAHVMVLYWAESAIIGFYTVLKICAVAKLGALFVAPFFVGHFGGFMAIHFAFVYVLFVRGADAAPSNADVTRELIGIFGPVWPALVALFVSHGVSFAVNFIGRREYAGQTSSALMTAPYHRIMIMHVTIIFGGWLVMLLGTRAPALALLVLLKTGVDLHAHRREHAKPSPPPASPATPSR